MEHVFASREFDPPFSKADLFDLARRSEGCFGLHRIGWKSSYLALDGRSMLCHFRAPDLESARIAFRQTGSDASCLWPGTEHIADPTLEPNVLVERRFDEPADLEGLQAMEDANAWCLQSRRVTFSRTFFARDRKYMVCLYRAPDAESVRQAQLQAGLPVARVWAFQRFGIHNISLG